VPGGERRWPDELAAMLGVADYRNLGVPGATSGEVARGQLDECVELEPDVVTLICGANDVLLSVRPDIDAYAATFERMLTRLRRELPAAALLTATTPDLSTFMALRPRSRRRVERGMRALNEATRAVAGRKRVPCLEFAEHPRAGDRENFADDGFHPSPEGNRRAALAFALALDPDIDPQEVTA
jgi:lysophospholipase L1-like esterase